MISTEPAQRAGNDDLGLYTLAVVAVFVGVLFTFAAAVLNGGRLFLAVPVLTVLLSASGAYLSESYVVSMVLGLLPIYGTGVGEVVAASYDPLLVGIVNLLLLFSIGGILLATLGFLVGVAVRYGRDIASRARWVAVRVGASAVLCAGLYVAAENGWISYGVTLG